ncbi:hypothetical protein GLA29479_4779 [Lysobacter antibioticus]|nr:hypothetical protein GLA29479_4779 [Lysobacter antibioticus]
MAQGNEGDHGCAGPTLARPASPQPLVSTFAPAGEPARTTRPAPGRARTQRRHLAGRSRTEGEPSGHGRSSGLGHGARGASYCPSLPGIAPSA